MSATHDLALMRASMALDADPAAAARCAADILAVSPQHETARLLLASARRRLKDPSGAVTAIEPLARAHPGSAFLELELGRAYGEAGRRADAAAAYERAVGIDPALAEAWRDLARERLEGGDAASADAAYARFEHLSPRPPDLMDAYVALDANRLEAASGAIRQRLARSPDDVPALCLAAFVASRRGDEAGAEALLRRALEAQPASSIARERLAELLIRVGRVEEALPLITRLRAARPDDASLELLQAEAMRLIDRHEDGLALIEGLIERQGDRPEFWLVAGNQRRFSGHTGPAIEAYRRAIELRPGYGEAYWALSNLKTLRFTPADIAGMESQLAPSPPASTEATYLRFALGKALEDEGRDAAAFEHYAAGNAGARTGFAYDPAATTGFFERLASVFSASFFEARAGWGSASPEPIFIVGLPRSGSTLIEQILASHPEVEGTRELPEIPALARELAARSAEGATPYPESVESLGRAELETLAARYLERTRPFRRLGRPRFVDKMLGNFVSIGLIQLMFPRSIIIESGRHPMASGFACFKQLFNPGMSFAYDLAELGGYIRDYTALMTRFDAALPGRIHRVQYESLVANPESEVRRLLDHCRLRFEPACLRHHENPRVAQTVSSEQVRMPVYFDGVAQWRRFEAWLGPLRAALGPAADRSA
ncbi:MAG TPA: sulfotransferase [Steroidobacteraceae bacterium]|nr:sulfotransferase [Steroidobacteraceae bacterium]